MAKLTASSETPGFQATEFDRIGRICIVDNFYSYSMSKRDDKGTNTSMEARIIQSRLKRMLSDRFLINFEYEDLCVNYTECWFYSLTEKYARWGSNFQCRFFLSCIGWPFAHFA